MKIFDKSQKAILFIVIIIALFFVTYPIAEGASNDVLNVYGSKLRLQDAFAFKYTWYVWLVYTIIVGAVGFVLFNKKSN